MTLEWESNKPNSSTFLSFSPWYWKAKLLPALAPHVGHQIENPQDIWQDSSCVGFVTFVYWQKIPWLTKKPLLRFFQFTEHLIFQPATMKMKTIFEIRIFFSRGSSHSSQTSLSWFRLLSNGPDKPWKEDPANLSSSVSSLLCSSSEKMLFIWPKPFAVPFALWGAYRPWDNSKSPSARFLFIKSFLRLLFKSASICLVGETTEGNVKKGCVCGWVEGGCGHYLSIWVFVLFPLI